MPGILQHKLAQLYISCTYHCDSSKKDQGHMPDTFRRRSSPQPHTCLFLPGADGTMGQRCGSNVADRGRSMILEHWTTLQGPICSSCLVILLQMLTWTLPIGHGGDTGGHGGTERVSTLQNRMFKSLGAINIFSMENVWTRNSICHVLMTFDKQQKLI